MMDELPDTKESPEELNQRRIEGCIQIYVMRMPLYIDILRDACREPSTSPSGL
jgi:hypothetical protein